MKRIFKSPIYDRLNNPYSRVGLALAAVLVGLSVLGFFWTPYPPTEMSAALKLAAPSLLHPFGCDNMGRDILSRIMAGSGFTLTVGFATIAIGLSLGIVVGVLTGYYGGTMDNIIMRLNDALMSFPTILLALVIISLFGIGKDKLILTLGLIFIPSYARMIRGELIKLKSKEFVAMAKLIGVSDMRIAFVHILPNSVPVIISTLAIGFNNAVLAEASLSFLGIGVRPNEASLGRMLSEAQGYISAAPWYAMFTGGFIALLILSFGLISEGISREKRAAKNKRSDNRI